MQHEIELDTSFAWSDEDEITVITFSIGVNTVDNVGYDIRTVSTVYKDEENGMGMVDISELDDSDEVLDSSG